MLHQADEGRKDLFAHIADLGGAGRVLVLVILESVLAFEFLVALEMDFDEGRLSSQLILCFSYLVALEDRFSMRDLMLLQAMALIKALEAVFALELRDSGSAILWLILDLLVLGLFVFLQLLPRAESLIAVRAVEDVGRRDALLLDFDVYSHWIGLKMRHKTHFFFQASKCFLSPTTRPDRFAEKTDSPWRAYVAAYDLE